MFHFFVILDRRDVPNSDPCGSNYTQIGTFDLCLTFLVNLWAQAASVPNLTRGLCKLFNLHTWDQATFLFTKQGIHGYNMKHINFATILITKYSYISIKASWPSLAVTNPPCANSCPLPTVIIYFSFLL